MDDPKTFIVTNTQSKYVVYKLTDGIADAKSTCSHVNSRNVIKCDNKPEVTWYPRKNMSQMQIPHTAISKWLSGELYDVKKQDLLRQRRNIGVLLHQQNCVFDVIYRDEKYK